MTSESRLQFDRNQTSPRGGGSPVSLFALCSFILLLAIVALVPTFRQQAVIQYHMIPRTWDYPSDDVENDPLVRWFLYCSTRAVDFVEKNHPDDPYMHLAGAALTQDSTQARRLLEKAASSSNSPVVLAAWADELLAATPWYERLETIGVDPNNEGELLEAKTYLAESARTRLTPEEAAPVLNVVQAWHTHDPENAFPLIIEAWCLLGLHRDEEARNRWTEASHLPKASLYDGTRIYYVFRLLREMGVPAPEALLGSTNIVRPTALRHLAAIANAANFTSYTAISEGRTNVALGNWEETIAVGRLIQDSAETAQSFLAGVDVENIGASPIWIWLPDSVTNLTPLGALEGRYFHGRHHSLYEQEVGQEAGSQLALRLLKNRIDRQKLGSSYLSSFVIGPYELGSQFLLFCLLWLALIIGSLVLLFLLTPWRKRPERRSFSGAVLLALAIPTLMISAISAGVLIALASTFPVAPWYRSTAYQFAACAAAPFLLTLLTPFAAVLRRPRGHSLISTWRQALIGLLGMKIILAVALYLAFGLAGSIWRARWVNQWGSPDVTQMQIFRGVIGIGRQERGAPQGFIVPDSPPGADW